MRERLCRIPVLCCLLLLCAFAASAADRTGFDELTQLMDTARGVEAHVFAPKTWEKALEKYAEAKEDLAAGKKQKDLDKHVAEAREYTENAMKAAEVGKLSLKEYLEPREKAKQARAPILVQAIYAEAEEQFLKATGKVESGDVKGGLKEAEKASPYFNTAEMEAIRVEILGAADVLIEKAMADDAAKFALSTLDKARTAREKANTILTGNRYERSESVRQAKLAEYEAQHASNIALSVRSLNRNDQAWEKLMLVYEIQMNRVGEAFGLQWLPFDAGPLAAADTLLARIHALQAGNKSLQASLDQVSTHLGQALAGSEGAAPGADPVTLAAAANKRLAQLSAQIQSDQDRLDQLSQENRQVSGELATRQEREQKFRSAKSLITPAEGDVLYNASNDIVLRLHGLSFGVGKSDVSEKQIPLLEKVERIVEMFPGAHIAIEGHTDASGDAQANLQLSQKRAYAVMQYLRQSLLLPADRIQAIGYGVERPVASNQTADGRAKNRRIDIVIMR